MRVDQVHGDGSRTIILEPGDRIIFPKDVNGGGFLGAKKGEKATVINRRWSKPEFESIAFLEVQTDDMKAGGWGVITIAPWDCEFLETT